MQIELKIKEILRESGTIEKKIANIRKFMNWDAEKLKKAIIKYGTSSKDGCDSIINEFWGKSKKF